MPLSGKVRAPEIARSGLVASRGSTSGRPGSIMTAHPHLWVVDETLVFRYLRPPPLLSACSFPRDPQEADGRAWRPTNCREPNAAPFPSVAAVRNAARDECHAELVTPGTTRGPCPERPWGYEQRPRIQGGDSRARTASDLRAGTVGVRGRPRCRSRRPGGSITALLGTNGAGKTSTLEVIEGLAPATAGEVSVLGLDPIADRAEMRRRTGVLLQRSGFSGDLTVRETLRQWSATLTAPAPGRRDARAALARAARPTCACSRSPAARPAGSISRTR